MEVFSTPLEKQFGNGAMLRVIGCIQSLVPTPFPMVQKKHLYMRHVKQQTSPTSRSGSAASPCGAKIMVNDQEIWDRLSPVHVVIRKNMKRVWSTLYVQYSNM